MLQNHLMHQTIHLLTNGHLIWSGVQQPYMVFSHGPNLSVTPVLNIPDTRQLFHQLPVPDIHLLELMDLGRVNVDPFYLVNGVATQHPTGGGRF